MLINSERLYTDMINEFSRAELLLGEGIQKLKASKVAIFGVGGVGGHVAEALARCGVGTIDLIDNDVVSITNINRQIIALHSTLGLYKADVMAQRIADINPNAVVNVHKCFYTPQTSGEFDFTRYDCIIDAIDTVAGKIELAVQAEKCGVPIISSMGAGNKFNPTLFEVDDIYKTSVCPLARVMRTELKKRGVKKLKVVYSKEKPFKPSQTIPGDESKKRSLPGSLAFVPSVAGLIIASEVVKDLTGGQYAERT